MLLSVKELFVVLIIALLIFKLAKPVALTFMSSVDFDRRRRAWFALTIIAFLSPNLWVLVTFAIPVLVITGRNDPNPAAVYLMLMQTIPPLGQTLTIAGISLFRLDPFMLLALCVMTPAALRLLRTRDRARYRILVWIDLALLGYGILSSFQYLQAEAVGRALSDYVLRLHPSCANFCCHRLCTLLCNEPIECGSSFLG